LDYAKACVEVDKWQINLIFAGISVKEVKHRKRYSGYGCQRETHSRRCPTPVP
jgi:hypothetical protein